MHVAQISFYVDPEGHEPGQLLDAWHSLGDIAQAVASQGARVTVIQASRVAGRIERDDVVFHFVAPRDGALAHAPSFRALLNEAGADVIHVHGLNFARDVIALRAHAPRTPVLLQDHANRVPRFFWQ